MRTLAGVSVAVRIEGNAEQATERHRQLMPMCQIQSESAKSEAVRRFAAALQLKRPFSRLATRVGA
jgi:hypothetical protein